MNAYEVTIFYRFHREPTYAVGWTREVRRMECRKMLTDVGRGSGKACHA